MKNGVEIYDRYLRNAEERLGFELDPNHYEMYKERNFRWLDLATPATAMSAAGYVLVKDGCKDLSRVESAHKIALGRGLDLLDGSVARFMQQESDAGALADAGFDKLAMFTIAKAAWKQDAMPKPFIAYVGGINIAHFGLTAAAAIHHPQVGFRPPQEAKYAMAINNFAGGAYLYSNAFEHEKPELGYHETLKQFGDALAFSGGAFESTALYKYISRTKKT